jgi:hypothetical protein
MADNKKTTTKTGAPAAKPDAQNDDTPPVDPAPEPPVNGVNGSPVTPDKAPNSPLTIEEETALIDKANQEAAKNRRELDAKVDAKAKAEAEARIEKEQEAAARKAKLKALRASDRAIPDKPLPAEVYFMAFGHIVAAAVQSGSGENQAVTKAQTIMDLVMEQEGFVLSVRREQADLVAAD